MLGLIVECVLTPYLKEALERLLTDAGVPIYNSGGGSINFMGRLETYLGWRARYEGPNPFGQPK